ncbi:MAG: hypothetical protein AB1716_06750 [Planctomycetota bacterium]
MWFYSADRRLARPSSVAPYFVAFCAAVGLGMLLDAAVARAQTVPRQMNTELYGRGVGSVRQTGMAALGNVPWNVRELGSEYRNEAFLSGRLRSEFRGEYLSEGPLAPTGFGAYIPPAALPYGSMRPYDSGPRQVAALPARGPAQRVLGNAPPTPMPYTGVLHGSPAWAGGTLRLPLAAAPVTPGAAPAAPGVKPPLVSLNYGVVRGTPPPDAPRPPPLRIPPPLPMSQPASRPQAGR